MRHFVSGREIRRVDPKSFDLTTSCPECGYKIPPAEILHIDGEHIRCRSAGRMFHMVDETVLFI